MNDDKKEQLLNQLKRELRITWDKEETNSELNTIITNAEAYMNHLLGAEIDYTVPGIENILFIAYCSYAWNDCEEDFEDAYIKDILRCRAVYEVKAYEENAGTK